MTQPPLTLPALLTELVPALEHVHGLGLVHRDLKPENIFLRRREPLDLVLGDFGLVRLVEGSVHLTRGDGTPAYLPPEAEAEEAEVTPAWDWWSLGMICAELAGGRHPFALASGELASAAQIRRHFAAQKPIDLEAVSGERELLLCRGLLLADRRRRWGAEQVRAWLAGESPALPVAAAAAAPAGARTVLFGDAVHTDAASLATAFQGSWNEAMEKLFQARDGVLVAELEALLRQEHNGDALAALTDQVLPAEVGVRFARLLIEMNPGLAAKVGPIEITPPSLEQVALDVMQHPGESSALTSALRSLRACHVLRCWRELAGMERGPQIEREWLALLDAYDQATGNIQMRNLPSPDLAAAWLLLVAIDPERHVAELGDRVEQATASPAAETEWWATLASERNAPAVLVAALLTQGAAEVLARQVQAEAEVEARALQDYAGSEHGDLVSLAAAFQARWPEALGGLFRDRKLITALEELLREKGRVEPLQGPPREPIASLLLEMDPGIEPLVNGVSITPTGLESAALALIAAPGDQALADTLRIVRTSGVLATWSHLPDCAEGPKIGGAWNDQVTALETHLPSLMTQVRTPLPYDADRASAWILLTIVSPDEAEELRVKNEEALAEDQEATQRQITLSVAQPGAAQVHEDVAGDVAREDRLRPGGGGQADVETADQESREPERRTHKPRFRMPSGFFLAVVLLFSFIALVCTMLPQAETIGGVKPIVIILVSIVIVAGTIFLWARSEE